mmetsp:Transcript_50703/g.100338  ORF Transcript_50703/g.100338 Transcript_50703/m.100338 type:complete len:241 (+) Transcript_50703:611-1333(+)
MSKAWRWRMDAEGTKSKPGRVMAPCTNTVSPRRRASWANRKYRTTNPSSCSSFSFTPEEKGGEDNDAERQPRDSRRCFTESAKLLVTAWSSIEPAKPAPSRAASSSRLNSNALGDPMVHSRIHFRRLARVCGRPPWALSQDFRPGTLGSQKGGSSCSRPISPGVSSSDEKRSLFPSRLPMRSHTREGCASLRSHNKPAKRMSPGPLSNKSPPKTNPCPSAKTSLEVVPSKLKARDSPTYA